MSKPTKHYVQFLSDERQLALLAHYIDESIDALHKHEGLRSAQAIRRAKQVLDIIGLRIPPDGVFPKVQVADTDLDRSAVYIESWNDDEPEEELPDDFCPL